LSPPDRNKTRPGGKKREGEKKERKRKKEERKDKIFALESLRYISI
jgi:hypothetical protein